MASLVAPTYARRALTHVGSRRWSAQPRAPARGWAGLRAFSPCVARDWLRPHVLHPDTGTRPSVNPRPRVLFREPGGLGVPPFVNPGLAPGVGWMPLMSEHRAYRLYAHITWHTWRRVGCIDSAGVADVRSAVRSACERTAVRVMRDAVLTDHVHFVISFRPETRLSDFVRLAKCVAAVRANRRVPGSIKWCRGFFAATLNERDLDRAIRYVPKQFERHPDRIPTQKRSAQPRAPARG